MSVPDNIEKDILRALRTYSIKEQTPFPRYRRLTMKDEAETEAFRAGNSDLFVPNAINSYIRENIEIFGSISRNMLNTFERSGEYISLLRGWKESDKQIVLDGIKRKIEETYHAANMAEAKDCVKHSRNPIGGIPQHADWDSYKYREVQYFIELERCIFIKRYIVAYTKEYNRQKKVKEDENTRLHIQRYEAKKELKQAQKLKEETAKLAQKLNEETEKLALLKQANPHLNKRNKTLNNIFSKWNGKKKGGNMSLSKTRKITKRKY